MESDCPVGFWVCPLGSRIFTHRTVGNCLSNGKISAAMVSVEPWLSAIARHKLIDHLRRRGNRHHVDIDDHADTLAAPETEEAGTAADARQMLSGLPERQRVIVTAISIEGHSARDTGRRLGMSEGAVRVMLHRALKALAATYRKERPS